MLMSWIKGVDTRADSTRLRPTVQISLCTTMGNCTDMWKLLSKRAKKVGEATKVLYETRTQRMSVVALYLSSVE